jgi:hypothetical protein
VQGEHKDGAETDKGVSIKTAQDMHPEENSEVAG